MAGKTIGMKVSEEKYAEWAALAGTESISGWAKRMVEERLVLGDPHAPGPSFVFKEEGNAEPQKVKTTRREEAVTVPPEPIQVVDEIEPDPAGEMEPPPVDEFASIPTKKADAFPVKDERHADIKEYFDERKPGAHKHYPKWCSRCQRLGVPVCPGCKKMEGLT